MKKTVFCPIFLLLILAAVCICIATAPTSGEDDGIVSDAPQNPIARYFGSVSTDVELLRYDFQVVQDETSTIEITFKLTDNTVFQTLSYPLRDDFMPETVADGIEVMDMNADGIDDFLFDLGIYGHMRLGACLVYNAETEQYTFIEGFEELNIPRYINGYFVTQPIPMMLPMTVDRYLLDKTTLCHVGKLSIFDDGYQAFYTESEQVNGEWIVTKDMVTEDNIELAEWGRAPRK